MKNLALIIFIFSSSLYASSFHLDVGQTSTVYNRFSIPKSKADETTTPTDETLTSYRLTAYVGTANKNMFYFLYAPLETSYDFVADKNFTFNDASFSAGVATKVNYKFNSYRIGYLWNFSHASLNYWMGVVGKIRDAQIEIVQGSTSDAFNNVGFVPLLSFGFDWMLGAGFSLFSHSDFLGSSQGSAYDSQLELKWSANSFAVSAGKRILGGGADNDKVYNFAQFDTYYLRLSFIF